MLSASLLLASFCNIPAAQAQDRQDSATLTPADTAQPVTRDYGECPVDAINAAYQAAAAQDGAETFALVAIEQDTLRQCIERSNLIARLIAANNKVAQEIGITEAGAAALAPPASTPTPQNCPPVAESAVAPPGDTASAERAASVGTTVAPAALPRPQVSCARGFEVVYTAGAGRNLTALIQRRDEQWHVSRGFELPGGVRVKTINGADVIITENGADHTLPAAAAQTDGGNDN